ncbi:LysR family transcriptional regulator [Roseateles sp. BYS180W]|uniref:LysR family transcriptional regulator n=1 Tax=Roseateles rivi TaxID=3299028 RepID=A0ABW7FQY5_9BURK
MNQHLRTRPLTLNTLRAFEAVARLLNFRAAAEELHLTQSAVSRQIQSLEQELGVPLFVRGTRHVALTKDGQLLHTQVQPLLHRLDTTVHHIRRRSTRRIINLSTFASFASLWLIPRLEAFQRIHPDVDIRISANDSLDDMEGGELDLALRYIASGRLPAGSIALFGEVLTPVCSPWLLDQAQRGQIPPLQRVPDLAAHTLAEEEAHLPGATYLSWRYWLTQRGHPQLQPRRWMYLNFTYQQVQAAMSGQAVAMARLALVHDSLQRSELVEPFGLSGRVQCPARYGLLLSERGRSCPDVARFVQWLQDQALQTRSALGEIQRDSEDGLGGEG